MTLDIGIMSSSPTLSVEMKEGREGGRKGGKERREGGKEGTLKKKSNNKCKSYIRSEIVLGRLGDSVS